MYNYRNSAIILCYKYIHLKIVQLTSFLVIDENIYEGIFITLIKMWPVIFLDLPPVFQYWIWKLVKQVVVCLASGYHNYKDIWDAVIQ